MSLFFLVCTVLDCPVLCKSLKRVSVAPFAAAVDHIEVVRVLLEYGAKEMVDTPILNSRTPISSAARGWCWCFIFFIILCVRSLFGCLVVLCGHSASILVSVFTGWVVGVQMKSEGEILCGFSVCVTRVGYSFLCSACWSSTPTQSVPPVTVVEPLVDLHLPHQLSCAQSKAFLSFFSSSLRMRPIFSPLC